MSDARRDGGSFDVLCIGAGIGGLAAAMRAHDLGLSVALIESSGHVGGGGAYSGGLCWLPALASGDSLEAAEAYIAYAEGERGFGDRALRRDVLAAMRRAVRTCAESGVALDLVPGNPDVYYPDAPGSVASGRMYEAALAGAALRDWRPRLSPSPHYRIGLRHAELYDDAISAAEKQALFAQRERDDALTMGPGLAAQFARAALVQRGVPCFTELRATRLLIEDGRVAGLEAQGEDGAVIFRANRAVLIATGGYGWAPDAADLEGLPDFAEASPPSIAGDHFALVAPTGAEIARGNGPQFSMGAVTDPTEFHPGTQAPLCRQMFDAMGKPHTLVVNRAGRRFGDESYYVGINEALRAWDPHAKRWINFPCFLIFDEAYRRAYPLGGLPAGADYPPHVARADSLDELAQRLGVDATRLTETVARFNAGALEGRDPDHGRGESAFVRRRYGDPSHAPNACLGPISTPPFYGLPLRLLGTGLCTFGLRTDAAGAVLRRDGSRVAGLFATGNAVATTEFRGYVTGYANSRNIAMAFAAMEEIAQSRIMR